MIHFELILRRFGAKLVQSPVAYGVMHPIKCWLVLAQFLVKLIHQVMQPETWTKMGAALIGSALGQACFPGNPLSPILLGVGATLTLLGLIASPLKSALSVHRGERLAAAKEALKKALRSLPESFVTGLFFGLLIGGINLLAQIEVYRYRLLATDLQNRYGILKDLTPYIDPAHQAIYFLKPGSTWVEMATHIRYIDLAFFSQRPSGDLLLICDISRVSIEQLPALVSISTAVSTPLAAAASAGSTLLQDAEPLALERR